MITFPKDFFWGAATSAHQVEGDNCNCDWWEWEMQGAAREKSGKACRHYEYYQEDFDIAQSLNHNCHRISVEWSRIEPHEGEFCDAQISHYREVVSALRQRGIEPVVTLHHFTNPLWFSRKGGWEQKSSRAYFVRYARRIAEALCDKVSFWATINEPLIYVYEAYLIGAWPPQKKSLSAAHKVAHNFSCAHIQAYKAIHALYAQKKLPAPKVSIAHNIRAFVPCRDSLKNRLACYLRNKYFNFSILDTLARHHSLDFIGINYYSRDLIDLGPWDISGILMGTCKKHHDILPKNSLGWEIYPQGFYDLLIRLKKYNVPLFVLENGACTDDDALRWDFIYGHLKALSSAMQQGVKVQGYLYWSLVDNFEWDKGFGPRFGLVEIDYRTFERRIRLSAKRFAAVCKSGTLE